MLVQQIQDILSQAGYDSSAVNVTVDPNDSDRVLVKPQRPEVLIYEIADKLTAALPAGYRILTANSLSFRNREVSVRPVS